MFSSASFAATASRHAVVSLVTTLCSMTVKRLTILRLLCFSLKEHPPCPWGLTAEQCLGCLFLVEAWLAQVSQLALGRAYWPCSIVESGTLIGSMLVQGVHVVSPMINRRCGKLEDLCYTELGGRWRHVRAVGFVKT